MKANRKTCIGSVNVNSDCSTYMEYGTSCPILIHTVNTGHIIIVAFFNMGVAINGDEAIAM